MEVVLASQERCLAKVCHDRCDAASSMPKRVRIQRSPGDVPPCPCRWFCSKYVASLCEVARVAEAEARLLEKEGKSRRKAHTSTSNSNGDSKGAGVDTGTGKAARLLRVLIAAFNAFLRHCSLGPMYSKT